MNGFQLVCKVIDKYQGKARALYVPVQKAQEELAAENRDIVLVSRQLKTFADRGLMKDEYHYLQKGYNLVGEDAGKNTGKYINDDIKNEMQQKPAN